MRRVDDVATATIGANDGAEFAQGRVPTTATGNVPMSSNGDQRLNEEVNIEMPKDPMSCN